MGVTVVSTAFWHPWGIIDKELSMGEDGGGRMWSIGERALPGLSRAPRWPEPAQSLQHAAPIPPPSLSDPHFCVCIDHATWRIVAATRLSSRGAVAIEILTAEQVLSSGEPTLFWARDAFACGYELRAVGTRPKVPEASTAPSFVWPAGSSQDAFFEGACIQVEQLGRTMRKSQCCLPRAHRPIQRGRSRSPA